MLQIRTIVIFVVVASLSQRCYGARKYVQVALDFRSSVVQFVTLQIRSDINGVRDINFFSTFANIVWRYSLGCNVHKILSKCEQQRLRELNTTDNPACRRPLDDSLIIRLTQLLSGILYRGHYLGLLFISFKEIGRMNY